MRECCWPAEARAKRHPYCAKRVQVFSADNTALSVDSHSVSAVTFSHLKTRVDVV